jgi:hypothetical protein
MLFLLFYYYVTTILLLLINLQTFSIFNFYLILSLTDIHKLWIKCNNLFLQR